MRRTIWAYSAVGTASLPAVWSVPAEAQVYDWSGPFAGAALGVIFPNGNVPLNYPEGTTAPNTVFFNGGAPVFSSDPLSGIPWPSAAQLPGSGYLGNLSLGYDLQQGIIVYGGEVDASLLRGTIGTWTTGTVIDNTRTHGVTVSGGIDQLYSARSRIGVALDRLLLFGTGGLALGHADLRTTAYLDQGKGSADWQGVVSAWRLGFIAGAGAEYAGADHLSLKLEWLYYNLGQPRLPPQAQGTTGARPSTSRPTEQPSIFQAQSSGVGSIYASRTASVRHAGT